MLLVISHTSIQQPIAKLERADFAISIVAQQWIRTK